MEFRSMLKKMCVNSAIRVLLNKRLAALLLDQKQGKDRHFTHSSSKHCWMYKDTIGKFKT